MKSSKITPILGVKYPGEKCELYDRLSLFSQVSRGSVSVMKNGLTRVVFGVEPFDVGFSRDGDKLKLVSYSPMGLKRVYKTLCNGDPITKLFCPGTTHAYNTSASRFKPNKGTAHDYVISARFAKNCTNDGRYRVIQVIMSLANAGLRHFDIDVYKKSFVQLLAFDAFVWVEDK